MDISTQLEAWTIANSKYEEKRDYVGLSQASLSEEEITRNYMAGFPEIDDTAKLRCYKGYQMEADLLRRLKIVYGDRVTIPAQEISAFDGKVLGHPDFDFDEDPADCKSVPLDAHIPTGKLPRKVYMQAQASMWFKRRRRALVVYESRESGVVRHFWCYPIEPIQREIEEKYANVVKKIFGTSLPKPEWAINL